MAEHLTVGVLITNFCAWPLTEKAIGEVLRWSGNGISKIVVVDDASDAPANCPTSNKVSIHRNEKNLGYVRSVNAGMKLLHEEVILFLDCDAYPLMDLVPGMIRHFEADPKLGALGFFEVNGECKTRIAGDYEPTLMSFLAGQAFGAWLTRRGWCMGKRFALHSCCMAVRRQAFESVGGFDEVYDFLDADTDFSMRLMDAGWRIQTDANLKCFHRGSGSPQTTAKRVLRYHRNRWLLLRKHKLARLTNICRAILWLRHAFELLVLHSIQLLKQDSNENLQDKLAGRRKLLHSVKRDYL